MMMEYRNCFSLLLLLISTTTRCFFIKNKSHLSMSSRAMGSIFDSDENLARPWTRYFRSNDSKKVCFYNAETVVFAEFHSNSSALIHCEVLETRSLDGTDAVVELMKPIAKIVPLEFNVMVNLMETCQPLDDDFEFRNTGAFLDENNYYSSSATDGMKNSAQAHNSFSIFMGIAPGTKWCGAGDLAEHYFDLGKEREIDKCCRTHDICPLRIKGFTTRFNITNNSMYTRLHCQCDQRFYECLKGKNRPLADLIGHFYFNFLKSVCFDDDINGRKQFTEWKRKY